MWRCRNLILSYLAWRAPTPILELIFLLSGLFKSSTTLLTLWGLWRHLQFRSPSSGAKYARLARYHVVFRVLLGLEYYCWLGSSRCHLQTLWGCSVPSFGLIARYWWCFVSDQ